MSFIKQQVIEDYVNLALNNINSLESKNSCYFCFRTIRKEEIECTDPEGETALCPNCDMDCLIPGDIEIKVLRAIHNKVFKVKKDSK